MKKTLSLGLGLTLLLGLGACSDAPAPNRNADMQAYQGAQDPFMVPGWKVGDKDSWEKQMRSRAQAQNEYVRASVN